MKILVTGVAGQLGHDVMNELAKRGHEGIGSDLAPKYSGIADGSYVTTADYVSMDITDRASVAETLLKINPDAVIHCAFFYHTLPVPWLRLHTDLLEPLGEYDRIKSPVLADFCQT